MTTYHTGSHPGTIIREGWDAAAGQTAGEDDQLVAVVVNGDQELAERIARDLNDDERGLLFEAWGLIGMARRIAREGEDDIENWARFEECAADYFRRRDEDASSGPLSVPVSASQPQTQGSPRAEGAETISGRAGITWACTRCNRELDGNPLLCPHCGYTVYRPIETGADR